MSGCVADVIPVTGEGGVRCQLENRAWNVDSRTGGTSGCVADVVPVAGEEGGSNVNLRIQEYLAHKNPPPVGPYSSPTPRNLWWSSGGGCFL